MNTAKKAASDSIVDDDVPPPVESTRKVVEQPADGSDRIASTELGMTPVVDNARAASEGGTVRMVNPDGLEIDVDAAEAAVHARSGGWKIKAGED